VALADMADVVDIKVNPRRLPGEQLIVTFANGYGASCVRSQFSYGGEQGLWEVAVLDKDGRLTYATPVSDDVIGHLEVEEVVDVLRQIAALTEAEVEAAVRERELAEIAEELGDVLNWATAAGVWVSGLSSGGFSVGRTGEDTATQLELDTATGQWRVTR
jgi:hypothetical protein